MVEDSIKNTDLKGHVFSEMFGIFGKHKYTVTVWQYSTQCYHKIKRSGAALKCLLETMNQLQIAIEPEKGAS